MSVIATINVGANGATSSQGSSLALSTAPDRQRFLALHRRAGAHITGSRSAASELYTKKKIPLIVLSRSQENQSTSEIEVINTSAGLPDAMRLIRLRFSPPLVVEAGPILLIALVQNGCIEEIELSISPILGDADFIDVAELMGHFEFVSDELVDGTRLLHGRYKGDSAYR